MKFFKVATCCYMLQNAFRIVFFVENIFPVHFEAFFSEIRKKSNLEKLENMMKKQNILKKKNAFLFLKGILNNVGGHKISRGGRVTCLLYNWISLFETDILLVFDFTGLELHMSFFPLRVSIPCVPISSTLISLEKICNGFLRNFEACYLYTVIIWEFSKSLSVDSNFFHLQMTLKICFFFRSRLGFRFDFSVQP